MKLIVGLGNPDKEYSNTRHNVGFMAIDQIANFLGVTFNSKKFNGSYIKLNYKGEEIILLKPLKYMNLSGEVVRDFVNYFKIDINDILIISDDMDLSIGSMKLKYKGSCGGHNGLRNIETHLSTQEYKRLKIGISKSTLIDTKDYVLGKLSKEEKEEINKILNIVPNIFLDYLNIDFEKLMSKYN